MSKEKKAIILLSGGLDSSTLLAMTINQGYKPYCLSFVYGQRHNIELTAAKKVVKNAGYSDLHKIITIDLKSFGHSALTDDIEVPKDRAIESIGSGKIPITYVPARNTIFLSYALAYAEVVDACDIFIGANIVDYSGYPDCRPKFVEAFNKLANVAIAKAVEGEEIIIHAPLMNMNKVEIIQAGLKLGVDYADTLSCYDPDNNGYACGQCDACILRLNAFKELNLTDPAKYKKIN